MEKNRPYNNIEDLLEDELFISFVNQPTHEGEMYWKERMEENNISRENFELAMFCIRSLHITPDSLVKDEISDMWVNIRIENTKRKHRQKRKLLLWVTAVAASFTALFGIFIFRMDVTENTAYSVPDISTISKPDYSGNDIRVILSDNNPIALSDKNVEITYNEKGEAEINSQLINPSAIPVNTYDQVIIPKGKQSSLTLSDGTRIWLNSSSRIVYPPVFDKDNREIYIEGQAYLEVKNDKDRPFTVRTNRMEVKVLGTSFNISAYENDESQDVVLVEGSVVVRTNETNPKETQLKPNELFSLTDKEIVIRTVDVNKYISWKEGFYMYERENLSHIFKVVADYYGVRINYTPEVGEMRYSGKLDLRENADRLLFGLGYTAPILCEKRNDIYYLSIKQLNN